MQIAERTARKFRFCEISLCVIAILALSVSAISACACTHHQVKAAEERPSCHSSSHTEAAQPEADNPESGYFNANCSCFVNTPVPAIFSKTEVKKVAAEKAAGNGHVLVAAIMPFVGELKRETPLFEAAVLSYAGEHLVSGPSRAPPRL